MKRYGKKVDVSTPYSKKVTTKVNHKITIPREEKEDLDNGIIVMKDRVTNIKHLYHQFSRMNISYITDKLTDSEQANLYARARGFLGKWNALGVEYRYNKSQYTKDKFLSSYKKAGAVRKIGNIYYLNPIIMNYKETMQYDIVKIFEDVNKPNGVNLYKDLYSLCSQD